MSWETDHDSGIIIEEMPHRLGRTLGFSPTNSSFLILSMKIRFICVVSVLSFLSKSSLNNGFVLKLIDNF